MCVFLLVRYVHMHWARVWKNLLLLFLFAVAAVVAVGLLRATVELFTSMSIQVFEFPRHPSNSIFHMASCRLSESLESIRTVCSFFFLFGSLAFTFVYCSILLYSPHRSLLCVKLYGPGPTIKYIQTHIVASATLEKQLTSFVLPWHEWK